MPARIELINTGTELMLGFTVNSLLSYIARKLADIGLRLDRQTTVADDRAEMCAVVADTLARSDIILITGGLGPTSDDFTREVVAELLGRKLVRDDAIAAGIAERFRKRGIRMPDSVNVQALVPVGAQVLPNPNGTAPGLAIEHERKLLLLLPGPPRELKPMFEQYVLPVLKKHFGGDAPVNCRVFKVVGLAESLVEEKVAPALRDVPDIELGYCAKMGEVEVRIIGTNIAEAERRVRAALGDSIYGAGDDRLEDVVVKMLTAARKTITVAESCTGGIIAHRLTNVSGASEVFLEGCVTYSNKSKVRLLSVREETLKKFGAVSEEVARAMAEGCRQRSGADFGVSTTGIAGPTGGTSEKPVGLVFIGLATPARTEVKRYMLLFDRETFKFFASQYALDAVRRELLREGHGGQPFGMPALQTDRNCRARSPERLRAESVGKNMIRAFIAVEIPEDVRAAIEEAQARLKRAHTGVKVSWTRTGNLHLTLQFLGYVEEPVIPKIGAALEAVAQRHEPFDLAVHGAGAFPSENRPRVLWVGCDDEAGKLKALAGSVQEAMQPLGFEPEHREFSAHLTLGRVKFPRPDAALTRALDSIKDSACGLMRVEAVHLMESQLHPDGSIYTKLGTHKLVGPLRSAGAA